MFIQDFIVGPFYFIIIMIIGFFIKRRLKDPLDSKYFIYGLLLKLTGAFFVFIIYFFYYNSGDTVYYFKRAVFIDSVLFNNFTVGLKLIFSDPSIYDFDTAGFFRILNANDRSSYLIARICALTNLICFNSYLGNALLFSVLSYFGVWKIYKLFNELFPDSKRSVAFSVLFMPSVFFWGSGVFKDCITLGCLGVFISAIFYLIIKREKIIFNSFLIIISVYLIGIVKSYILLAIAPSLFFWIFFEFRNKIKADFLKVVATPFFIILTIVIGALSLQLLSKSFSKFSLSNIQTKAEDMQRWHLYTVEVLQDGEGSSYNLGNIDFSTTGIIKKIPAGINVAIFRPYLWEVRSPIVLLSALESTFMLMITLKLMWLTLRNPISFFRLLNNNASLIFMLLFSLIFAFSVGFTSYNFGALSRYRIPMIPFYMTFVLVTTKNLQDLLIMKK